MKNTLSSPQVVAAIISGIVALILAIVPTIINNSATASPTATPAPISSDLVLEPTAIPTRVSLPTEPPTLIPSLIATETPVNLPTSILSLTPIPTEVALEATEAAPANVLLAYDDVSFTIYNQSAQSLSITDLHFRSADASWDATKWGPSLTNNFRANNCLRLRNINSGQRQAPSYCGTLLGLQLVDPSLLFWTNADEFDVFKGDNLIASCATANDTCPIFVP